MDDNGSSMLEQSETQPVVNGEEHDVEMKDELAPEVGFLPTPQLRLVLTVFIAFISAFIPISGFE